MMDTGLQQLQLAPVADPDERRIPLPAGFNEHNSIVLSASQIKTWELCGRKWLGEKVFKLPVPEKGFLLFGTALHGVCERFLRADDRGRDPNGLTVDLFPAGWDEGLSKLDSDLIQKLVTRAIGEGILVRHPGRRIEHGFLRPLVEADGITVFLTGWIDYLRPFEAVEDHKTTKDIGRWALNEKPDSDKYLGDDRQMLIYAHELLLLAEEAGEVPPDEILLRHNYFCKNTEKPAIKPVEVTVTRNRVLQNWQELKIIAIEMVRAKATHTALANWHEFPLPRTQVRACEAYGGCPYRTICGGRETPFRYMNRHQESVTMNAINGPVPTQVPGIGTIRRMPAPPAAPQRQFNLVDPSTEQHRVVSESDLQALMGQFGPDLYVLAVGEASQTWKTPADYGIAPQAPAPAAPAAPAPPPQPAQQQPVQQSAPAPTAPPWANAACKACLGRGFNSQGNPCRICYGQCAPENHPQHFAITADGQGNVTWTRNGNAPAQQPMPAAPPASAISTPAQQPAVGLSPDLQQMQQSIAQRIEAEQPAAPGQAQTPATPKRGPGRPKKNAEGAPATPAAAPAVTQAPAPNVWTTVPAQAPAPVAAAPAQSVAKGGFVLLVNCVPSKIEQGGVIDLSTVLEKWGGMLAQSKQTPSYWLLETFSRRNELASQAQRIVAELSGFVVVRRDKGSDLAALADAIRPYASDVIEAAA